jgi:mono/diheme cytochrome c family protein
MISRTSVRRIVYRLLIAALLALAGVAIYVGVLVSQFNSSMAGVYDVREPVVQPAEKAEALARGRQLVESIGGCAGAACHGADLGGGKTTEFGPIGRITAPNIAGSALANYSDGALARLFRDGVKRDGRSVLFMPVEEFNWLPPSDVAAMIAYLRTVPAVDRRAGPTSITILGKVLDRRGTLAFDVARRVDHSRTAEGLPRPAPTAEYGRFLAKGCTGCHGEHLGGGPLPGAPASLAVPANLTPDATGLAAWTFGDFERALNTGIRKDGRRLDPLMPFDSYANYDDTQKRALWEYLQTVPSAPFGSR